MKRVSLIVLLVGIFAIGLTFKENKQYKNSNNLHNYMSRMDISFLDKLQAADQSASYTLGQELYYFVAGDPNDAEAFSLIGLVGSVSDKLESGLKQGGLQSCSDIASAIGYADDLTVGVYNVTIAAPGDDIIPSGYTNAGEKYAAQILITGPENLDMKAHYKCNANVVSGKFVIAHDNIDLPNLGATNIKMELFFEINTSDDTIQLLDTVVQDAAAGQALNVAFSFKSQRTDDGDDFRLAVLRDIANTADDSADCGLMMEGNTTAGKIRVRSYKPGDEAATTDAWSKFGGELCIDMTTKADGADCTGIGALYSVPIRRSLVTSPAMTMTDLRSITL